MKTKELIKYLSKLDPELEIFVFVEGKLYYPENAQEFKEGHKEFNEIGCGWLSLDWEEV
jgi:hypothetical protein